MADFTPTAVSKSSNFVSGTGDTTADVLDDLLENRTEIYELMTSVSEQFYGTVAPTSPNVGTVWYDSANAVLKRWSGTAWVEDTTFSVNLSVRNSVLQGKVDASGNPELFTGSTGALTAQLNATTTPLIITWMDGNDGAEGEKNKIGTVAADSATFWSGLPQNSTVYLYIELIGSAISGGYSTAAPKQQSVAPTHSAGLDWINYNTGEVYYSNGSTWTKKYKVYVGTVTTDTTKVTASYCYRYLDNTKRDVKTIIICNPDADAISLKLLFKDATTLYAVQLDSVKLTDATTPPTASSILVTPTGSTTIKIYGISGSTVTELDSNTMTTASLLHTLLTPVSIPADSWVMVKIVGEVNGIVCLSCGLVVG